MPATEAAMTLHNGYQTALKKMVWSFIYRHKESTMSVKSEKSDGTV